MATAVVAVRKKKTDLPWHLALGNIPTVGVHCVLILHVGGLNIYCIA